MKKPLLITAIIFSAFLSQAQLNSNLSAFFPFNGNAEDESGNDQHAITQTASLTPDRFGTVNSAYYFDGSQYIQIPASLGNSFPITISLWFNSDNLTNPSAIQRMIAFSNTGSVKQSLSMNYNYNGTQVVDFRSEGFPSGSFLMNSSSSYNINTWYHVVMTVNSEVNVNAPLGYEYHVYMYVNGVQESFATFTFDPITPDAGYIGKFNASNSQAFTGKIDDVGIWNKVLTAQEITDLYNGSLPTLTSGINSKNIDHPNIYPNPANEVVYLSFSNECKFDVFNLIGDKINSHSGSNYYELDITNYPSGVYFITTENGATSKFVKN